MTNSPEKFAGFYDHQQLGFDLRLVLMGYQQFKPFFKGNLGLELGPATGYMTNLLHEDFENLVIVEGSESLLKQVPEYTNVTKIHSLFETYSPNLKFDTIILNHVLEHIENPTDLLKRIFNWMKDDGVAIVGVPNAKSFHRLAAVKMGLLKSEYELNERDNKLGHYRVYDFIQLREHVRKAGFKISYEGGVFLKFLSNDQIEKCLNDKIIDAYFCMGNEFKENSAEIFVVLTK